MRSAWLTNIILLSITIVIGVILYRHFLDAPKTQIQFTVSRQSLTNLQNIRIELPNKDPIDFVKKDNYWYMAKPYSARADQQAILAIINTLKAQSAEKIPATDLSKFELDNPRATLSFDNKQLHFGTINTINNLQYVLSDGFIYLLPITYLENIKMPITEFLDKALLPPNSEIVGFDFSHLEQWQKQKLKLTFHNGVWQLNGRDAPQLKEWFSTYWRNSPFATKVTPYLTTQHKDKLPFIDIVLSKDKTIRLFQLQESPELILANPQEQMAYTFSSDEGFNLLNPPVGELANW